MEKADPKQNLIHDLDSAKSSGLPLNKLLIFLVVTILLGMFSGFIISKVKPRAGSSGKPGEEKLQKSAGIQDKKTFKDKAEGVLKEGGADGEGNFHLERVGGESQNVYLTSTTVDLSQYINKKVRVWGETFGAQKAGWLMDVGLVELLQ